jgi:type II secretory ATPase GspE/PulE/Tfp pilus assembly ATPase PilB-like protein
MATHPYPETIPEPCTLFKPVGCKECGNTGFKGRMGVFEGVLMDPQVEEVVVRDPREHAIYEAARPQKIPTMLQDGIVKVLHGHTSITELKRVVEFARDVNYLDNADMLEANSALTKKTDEISGDDFIEHIV